MKFFFPDSQDTVDPGFDFVTEKWSEGRVRQRDDEYAHEVFSSPAFDGLLVSKGIVDGTGASASRYTLAQRHRLFRAGVRSFFRLDQLTGWGPALSTMGDCGAFTYVREEVPPYTVDEVLDFYGACRFDFGISVDHVILAYQPGWDGVGLGDSGAPPDVLRRHALTLELAAEFLSKHGRRRLGFRPVGVAHGWSPRSYAHSVRELQRIGYRYIALGGMVPLKTKEILAALQAASDVRGADTVFHLLGVTRIERVGDFSSFGVVSFDSTSPLRQAFKDDKDNYYASERTFTAVRIPQVEGNLNLKRRIQAGEVSQDVARRLERTALDAMTRFDSGAMSLDDTLSALLAYEAVFDPLADHAAAYRDVLEHAPWRSCPCDVCRRIGHHVILFRGAERNRRRGFHNLWVFYRRLHDLVGIAQQARAKAGTLPAGRVEAST